MSPVLKATVGGGVNVDPGTYEALCLEAKADTLQNPQFGNGDVLRIKVELVGIKDEDGEPVVLDGMASLKLSPMSKLWGWVSAFGFKLDVGQEFDTDLLRGKRAFAVVGQREGQDGALWARIEDFVPLPKGAQPVSTSADVIRFDENGTPHPDWTVFWNLLRKHGITPKNVQDAYGDVKVTDPFDLPGIVDELIEKATA
jgi:hypothetical protein